MQPHNPAPPFGGLPLNFGYSSEPWAPLGSVAALKLLPDSFRKEHRQFEHRPVRTQLCTTALGDQTQQAQQLLQVRPLPEASAVTLSPREVMAQTGISLSTGRRRVLFGRGFPLPAD